MSSLLDLYAERLNTSRNALIEQDLLAPYEAAAETVKVIKEQDLPLEEPWIDPVSAGVGGGGMGFMGALRRPSAKALNALLKAFVSGSASALSEYPVGQATEMVGEKHPKFELPFNFLAGMVSGAGVLPAIPKIGKIGKPEVGQKIKIIRYGKPVKHSRDWSAGKDLPGMSVYSIDSKGAAQQTVRAEFADRKNVYYGTGEVVGFGPDGEPLVVNFKLKKATKLQEEKAYYGGVSRAEWLKNHGYDELGNKVRDMDVLQKRTETESLK